jgi:plasmid stability protein
MAMKTTLELPDDLMRRIKIRAAATDRKLKDTVEELVRRGLEVAESGEADHPFQSLRDRLRFNPDGSVTNPAGIDDPAFFEALDEIRAESRREVPRDPFVEDSSG